MTTTITKTGTRATVCHLAATALCCFAAGSAPNLTMAQESHEDRCLGVINKSRGEARSIASREDFFTHQRNFCREFESARSDERTASFGLSYNVLSLSSSSSRMSADAVAEQYCEEDGTIRHSDEDYDNYTSQVPDDAFRAYEACLRMAQQDGVIFDHDGSVFIHNELLFGVRFNADSREETARVRWTAIPRDGTTCEWEGTAESGNAIDMTDSSQANLRCQRENWKSKSAVIIDRENGSARMAFDWPAYAQENGGYFPVNLLKEVQDRISHLEGDVKDIEAKKLRIETGDIDLYHERTPELLRPTQGTGGNYAPRGTIEGEVNFEAPFKSVPKVVFGFNALDISHDRNTRLRLSVRDVDENGFTYRFVTWADTKIYWARGSWIAYGR